MEKELEELKNLAFESFGKKVPIEGYQLWILLVTIEKLMEDVGYLESTIKNIQNPGYY